MKNEFYYRPAEKPKIPTRRAQVPGTDHDWPLAPPPLTIFTKLKLALAIRRTLKSIPKPMKLHGSWKTSLFGAGGLATIVFNVASMLLDDNPATNPDWSIILPLLMTSIGALFAKDANVSNAQHPLQTAAKVE